MSEHVYSVAEDTANAAVNVDLLEAEIRADAEIKKALAATTVSGDQITLTFKEELKQDEVDALDALVAAHTAKSISLSTLKLIELRIQDVDTLEVFTVKVA